MNIFSLIALLIIFNSPQDEKNKGLNVVPYVDLEKYSGLWYEIARLPNKFQNKCAGNVTASYKLQEDGKINVINRCVREDGSTIEAEGVAKLADKNGPNTKLKVRFAPAILSFLPFVWGDYWIIELAEDYSYAVVGEPNRKYLWILSRKPQMNAELYENLLNKIKSFGYDVSKIVRTKQK
ncbi:MAG: Outer membrane lipoprotein Blc [Ignavibacteriae bacterium]|nr:MAG: Outer membrane lipoprotein Blc [Ignavibacteriota bacterium]